MNLNKLSHDLEAKVPLIVITVMRKIKIINMTIQLMT